MTIAHSDDLQLRCKTTKDDGSSLTQPIFAYSLIAVEPYQIAVALNIIKTAAQVLTLWPTRITSYRVPLGVVLAL